MSFIERVKSIALRPSDKWPPRNGVPVMAAGSKDEALPFMVLSVICACLAGVALSIALGIAPGFQRFASDSSGTMLSRPASARGSTSSDRRQATIAPGAALAASAAQTAADNGDTAAQAAGP